jgi:hypothetical protein
MLSKAYRISTQSYCVTNERVSRRTNREALMRRAEELGVSLASTMFLIVEYV